MSGMFGKRTSRSYLGPDNDDNNAVERFSSTRKELKNTLECSVCTNIFEEPKILSCGHTFCQSCVNRLVQDRGDNTIFFHHGHGMSSHVLRVALNHDIIGIGQITCPQCRVVSDVPAGGYKTNFIVKDMVTALKDFDENEKKRLISCSYCKRRTNKLELFTCNTCNENPQKKQRDDSNSTSASMTKEKPHLCSICIIKQHKMHDVSCCEFVTDEQREISAQQIDFYGKAAADCIGKLSEYTDSIYVQIQSMDDYFKEKFQHGLDIIDDLRIECLNDQHAVLKDDLDFRVNKATTINSRLHWSIDKLRRLRGNIIDKMNELKNAADQTFSRDDLEENMSPNDADEIQMLDGGSTNDLVDITNDLIILEDTHVPSFCIPGPSHSLDLPAQNNNLFEMSAKEARSPGHAQRSARRRHRHSNKLFNKMYPHIESE